jgi:hypothetical protein
MPAAPPRSVLTHQEKGKPSDKSVGREKAFTGEAAGIFK